MTSREVALSLGIEPSYYRRIEIGEATPSAAVANEIEKHFEGKVTRDQILFPEDYVEASRKKPIAQRRERAA